MKIKNIGQRIFTVASGVEIHPGSVLELDSVLVLKLSKLYSDELVLIEEPKAEPVVETKKPRTRKHGVSPSDGI